MRSGFAFASLRQYYKEFSGTTKGRSTEKIPGALKYFCTGRERSSHLNERLFHARHFGGRASAGLFFDVCGDLFKKSDAQSPMSKAWGRNWRQAGRLSYAGR